MSLEMKVRVIYITTSIHTNILVALIYKIDKLIPYKYFNIYENYQKKNLQKKDGGSRQYTVHIMELKSSSFITSSICSIER